MTCDDVRISLGVYVLGALDAEETAVVEAHLDECPDCLAELAELSGLPPFLARVSEEDIKHATEPPREVLDRLLAATVRRRRRTVIMLALAASVVVAALGGTTWIATAQPSTDSAAGASVASGQAQESAADSLAVAPRTEKSSGAADGSAEMLRQQDISTVEESGRSGSVEMQVQLTAGEGGTKVQATVTGLRPGVVCRLTAVGRDGTRSGVASWSNTAQGYSAASVTFEGSTELAIESIGHFELATANGRTLVTVPLKHGE
ncbi:zf-HC2 domain-containing protein [Microtetraspora sp. NBRC 16547]|uniref:anti-sigma factor family protein n=1 Tax=Microtetraspora sp. NBRC 16547 TaxID=3030993 RepID=UPI0024A51DBB|nr:zf-HC2 domain-containing protein [Microtetraspora sp. NBRC 16547]GLW96443.1 anti-sigma factor [Microtetraspora sp. NBRC 16547]